MQISISSPDFTIDEMTKVWQDGALTPEQARAAANLEYAYLVNHTGATMRGWMFTQGQFTGRNRFDALRKIGELQLEAVDHVCALLPQIVAELPAPAAT